MSSVIRMSVNACNVTFERDGRSTCYEIGPFGARNWSLDLDRNERLKTDRRNAGKIDILYPRHDSKCARVAQWRSPCALARTLRTGSILAFTGCWNIGFLGAGYGRALRKLVNEHLRCSAFANLSAYTFRKVFHHA